MDPSKTVDMAAISNDHGVAAFEKYKKHMLECKKELRDYCDILNATTAKDILQARILMGEDPSKTEGIDRAMLELVQELDSDSRPKSKLKFQSGNVAWNPN